MTRTTTKLLTATTALLALAGAANATTISSGTSVVKTSETIGGLTVGNGVVLDVSNGTQSAIEVSGTSATGAVSNTINISDTATVKGNYNNGVIHVQSDSAGVVTINNSGTISVYGGSTKAIVNDGTLTGATTIRNTGTISGSIILSNTADIITLSGNGAINGNVDMGGGDDTFNIYGGSVSGTIDMGSGSNDTMNISATTFTTKGAISNVEKVNISGTTNINNAITGVQTLTANRGSVVNVNSDFGQGAASTVNVSGTLNVAAGKTVSASTVNSRGGVIGIAVATSSSAGLISANSFTGGSLTINLGSSAGYINSGTQFRIVSGTTGASVLPSLTTATSGLYTFNVSRTNTNDISLTILRAANATAATNGTNAAVGAVLDSVSSSTNTQLVQVQNLINQQTTLAGVNNVLERLTPAADTGIALSAVDVNVQTGNQISSRLASLRGNGKTLNTGDAMLNNHFWMNGFGNVTNQDDKKGVRGYDANTVGASVGLDTDTLVDGTTTGLAFSYGKSNVDSNSANGASTDIDSYQLTGYASRVFDGGVFLNGQAAIGLGKYSSDRNTGLGTASADYDGMQYSAKLEGGKDFVCDWWTFTPLASAQYSFVDLDKYTESGPGALTVDSKNFNVLDLGLGGQVAYNIPLESGGSLRPVARAKYIYRAGDNTLDTTSRFVAGGAAFNTQGIRADRNSVNLGTGITLSTVGGMDLSLDYDADIRSSLVGHTGQVKARWAF